jgi:hypothetical protein
MLTCSRCNTVFAEVEDLWNHSRTEHQKVYDDIEDAVEAGQDQDSRDWDAWNDDRALGL